MHTPIRDTDTANYQQNSIAISPLNTCLIRPLFAAVLGVSVAGVLPACVMAGDDTTGDGGLMQEFSDTDTRIYFEAGASFFRDSTSTSPEFDVDFTPETGTRVAMGIEQDLFLGFGITAKYAYTKTSFDAVDQYSTTEIFGTSIRNLDDSYSVTDGSYEASAAILGLNYRVENDVLEPYFGVGLGQARYTMSGRWDDTDYAREDTGLVYDFSAGLDYISERGFTVGLSYNLQILDDPMLDNGGSVHSLGLRLGGEFQNAFWGR